MIALNMWTLNKTKESIYKTEIDSDIGNKFKVIKGDMEQARINQECGISRYKLLCEKKQNKTLPSFLWASLVTQLVKNPPAMWETWVRSLVRSPGEGKGYPLQFSGLENSMDCIVLGIAKSQIRLSDFHFTSHPSDNSSHVKSVTGYSDLKLFTD